MEGSERGRVIARNSEKEREGVRGAVSWPEIAKGAGGSERE